MPTPWKAVLAKSPPFSPAMRTDAQAAPSGYFSSSCSLTMRERRSGIIIRTPRMPPTSERVNRVA